MKAFFLLLILAPLSAFSALGDKVSTPSAVQAKSTTNSTFTVAPVYTVQETKYDGGSYREYIYNGQVFAVAWRGTVHADPAKILGHYHSNFKIAQKNYQHSPTRAFKKPTHMQEQDFVYETYGHMGDVRGRAYIPSLLPDSVQLRDLQ